MICIHPLLLYSYGNMPLSAWAQANQALLKGETNCARMPLYTGNLLMAHVGDDLHIDMEGKTYVVAIEDMISDNTILIQDLLKEPVSWINIELSKEVKTHIISNAKFVYSYLYSSYGRNRIYPQIVSDRMEFTCIHSIQNDSIFKGYSFQGIIEQKLSSLPFYKDYVNLDTAFKYVSGLKDTILSKRQCHLDYFPVLCQMNEQGVITREIPLPHICFASVAGAHLWYERDLHAQIRADGIILLPFNVFLDRASGFTRCYELTECSQFVKAANPKYCSQATHSRLWYPKHQNILSNPENGNSSKHVISFLNFLWKENIYKISMKTHLNRIGIIYFWKKQNNEKQLLKRLYLFDNADQEACKSQAVNEAILNFTSA